MCTRSGCSAAPTRKSGLASGDDWWKLPFQKCDEVSLYEQRDDGTWLRQSVHLPRRGGANRALRPSRSASRWAASWLAPRGCSRPFAHRAGNRGARRGGAGSSADGDVDAAASALEAIAAAMDGIESPVLLGADAPAVATRGRTQVLQAIRRPVVTDAAQALIGDLERTSAGFRRRRPAPRRRTGCVCGEECSSWSPHRLRASSETTCCGAGSMCSSKRTSETARATRRHRGDDVARSPVLRGLYDLTFAYRQGDKRRPSLAAGKGLQSLLMMINYEGSFNAAHAGRNGRRGVCAAVPRTEAAGSEVSLLLRGHEAAADARAARGRCNRADPARRCGRARRYDPIERIGDWWCWPADPYGEQLADDPPTRQTLIRGSDFDDVVLAIPLGGLRTSAAS